MKKILISGLILLAFICPVKAQESGVSSCVVYDLDDERVMLSDYKGKPLMLWFWTTWCPYCRREIAQLNELQRELSLLGIELLAVNINEGKEKITRFLRHYPADFKVVRDKDAGCAFGLEIIGVPTYVLIDRQGDIRFKHNYFPRHTYKQLLLGER